MTNRRGSGRCATLARVAALGTMAALAASGCSGVPDGERGTTDDEPGSAVMSTSAVTRPAPQIGEAAAALPVMILPKLVRTEREVRKGEPLDTALTRMDLTPQERMRTVDALRGEIDLRRILPGEVVEVARTESGDLREVQLHRSELARVVVRFPENLTAVVETILRVPDTNVRRIEGVLHGSLYEAVIDAGGDANLTMRYADLLGWQVDFLTEPRPDDVFRIVVREEFLDGERLGFGKILSAEYHGARAEARAVRYVDSNGDLDWYDDDGKSVRRAFLKSPLNYRRISSRFTARRRHPILKTVRPHWGVDYAAPTGTPVSALGAGVVRFAGRQGGFGNYVEVRHNGTYTTCYGHLSRFARGIREGSRVEQGEVIGYVGSTGLSTGPHLDFRVKRNGKFVDPLRMDSPAGRVLAGPELARFEDYRDRMWQVADAVGVDESVPETVAWGRIGPPGLAEEVMAAVPSPAPTQRPAPGSLASGRDESDPAPAAGPTASKGAEVPSTR